MEPKISSGTYIFKVSLGRFWRTIAISGEDSLDQLHLAIQEAFNFDNDYLYAFSLDQLKLNPRKSFNDLRGGDYPFEDEAIIGKLNFYEGQRFLYVFDFGDWWDFDLVAKTQESTQQWGQPNRKQLEKSQCRGKPIVRGTRISVEFVLDLFPRGRV